MNHYSQLELRREVEITDSEDDRDVDHLPGDKEKDQEEDAGHRHEVVCLKEELLLVQWEVWYLVVQQIAHHLP